ncbi:hypothetical protein [Heyndrickxia coagulans]|uniref:hypothetical protein n=1 Tax=Heyndrickxia coagulans TaxID=1398 RepID=UPI002164CF01|nr:hypothetical protein [Heyndrickxia coagulans]
MSLKNDILVYLSKETEKFDWEHPSEQLTANGMQKVFHVKRNTVSTYLNQLVKENLVIKINTRPVYFLSRSVFEKKFFNTSKEKADILLQLITANVQETIQYLEKSNNIRFNGNNI